MEPWALAFSFAFIGVIVAFALILKKSGRLSSEGIRKFIHIGVSNWWFILITWFDTLEYAVIGPACFIVINGVAVLSGFTQWAGISESKRRLSLVWFPAALLILVVLGFSGTLPIWACGMGAMTMGYADGFAAVFGKKFGGKKVHNGKTLAGSAVMLAVTALVLLGFSWWYDLPALFTGRWWLSLAVISLAATLVEILTPFGLDNLTVPVSTALLAALLLG